MKTGWGATHHDNIISYVDPKGLFKVDLWEQGEPISLYITGVSVFKMDPDIEDLQEFIMLHPGDIDTVFGFICEVPPEPFLPYDSL